jgi:hypothetical protein
MTIAADGQRFVSRAIGKEVMFKGGCRCGGVKYTSREPAADFTMCHCRACQQLSGSAYLPFTSISLQAFEYVESSTLKTLKLTDAAERTFCSSCGTPITMAYMFRPDEISITMGSVDMESLACEVPKVKHHIYLREKAPWVAIPDDGAERWGTWEFAHLVPSKTD